MEDKQYDLASLDAQRAELNQKLTALEVKIKKDASSIFSKSAPKSKSEMLMANFERAMAIYDGAMMGYKLYHRFNGIVSFFKKKKNKKSNKQ